MNPIHLILIGDELLSGKRRDLHLQTIAQSLALHGARVASCEIIHDQAGEEEACVRRYLAPGAVIVTTGGLGPTLDDLTREGLSKATGVELREEPELWEDLRHRYERMGRPISSSNRSQALVPEHGTWFHNDHGTAPGLVFEPPDWPDCTVIALPGPPRELNPMWHEQALPHLIHRYQWPSPPHSILLRFAQMGESSIDEKMRPLLAPYPEIELSSLIRVARVDVTISLPAEYPRAVEILTEIADRTEVLFPEYVYERWDSFREGQLPARELEEVVSQRLRHRGEKLAVAESCTGGLLSSWMTEIAGSSDIFLGGVVSYDNRLKQDLLGVPAETLEHHGAVSEETVRCMAHGILEVTGADWGISISGIAGPGGGTSDKPVGLVWIGIGNRSGIETHRYEFPGDRDAVRERAAVTALSRLLQKMA